jgi:hypothetical protein
MNEKSQLRTWALTAVAVGIAIRLISFVYSSSDGGDSFARIATTAVWLRHPSLQLDFSLPDWPPVHFWLMAAFSDLIRNVVLGCRLLSLVFGCLSVWLLWRLASKIYDESSALFSVIIFALYSLGIGYSTTASSEATHIGLTLAGLLGFFSFRRTESLLSLGFAGLSLTIDAGVRYESWVIIFLLSLLLAGYPDGRDYLSLTRLRNLLVFASSASLWPAFWMLHEYRIKGNPLYFLAFNHQVLPEQLAINPAHGTLLYQALLLPSALVLTLTPFVILAALYGIGVAFRNRKGLEISLLILGFAAIELHTIATHGSLALARYSITLGTFMALPAGFGLKQCLDKYLHWSNSAFTVALAAVMGCNLIGITAFSMSHLPLTDKFRAVSPLLQFPRRIEEVRDFLGPRLAASDLIVIDDYNSEPNIISAALGLQIADFSRTYSTLAEPPSGAAAYIASHHPRYLIFSDQGKLRNFLSIPSGCSARILPLSNFNFRCVFHGSVYDIYEIAGDRSPE